MGGTSPMQTNKDPGRKAAYPQNTRLPDHSCRRPGCFAFGEPASIIAEQGSVVPASWYQPRFTETANYASASESGSGTSPHADQRMEQLQMAGSRGKHARPAQPQGFYMEKRIRCIAPPVPGSGNGTAGADRKKTRRFHGIDVTHLDSHRYAVWQCGISGRCIYKWEDPTTPVIYHPSPVPAQRISD